MSESYQEKLQRLADEYAHRVFRLSTALPKEEIYGITSQLRRASLSVPLNIIEGFSRNSEKSYKNFIRIALGSLKESEYLLLFCQREKLLAEDDTKKSLAITTELGKMLWGIIKHP